MKLLLVDDHAMFLEGLSFLLQKACGQCEVLTAHNVESAKQIITNHIDLDIILVDLNMPHVSGIALVHAVQQLNVLIPIVVLSATDCLEQIQEALNAGALGFISKSDNSERLVETILQVQSGNYQLPEKIRLALSQRHHVKQENQALAEQIGITPRQLEVLSLIDEGLANIKIADKLFISEHTVKSHLKQIFQKLAVSNRVESIKKAKELGLL